MELTLESRELHFVRYADDVNILVKSELSANRVMKSITSWLERKLFLKVSATKTKVVRPTKSHFLGFTFVKYSDKWHCKPMDIKVQNLYNKCKTILIRKKAVATPTRTLFTKLNEVIRGWINYFHIGKMKMKLLEFGKWLSHKVRVVILKKWKKPVTIYKNLKKLALIQKLEFEDVRLLGVANARQGIYRRAKLPIVNYIININILSLTNRKRGIIGLINPLDYYLAK